MSARNQLTHYELEEFFRSLQDLLGGLILFRFARGGGRRISCPVKSNSITKYFQQILRNIEPRRPGTPDLTTPTLAVESCSSILLRVQSEMR